MIIYVNYCIFLTGTKVKETLMEPNKNLLYIAVTLIFVIQCALAQLTLMVSKDGLGNFTTISQAIAAAPNHSSGRTIIKIKAGIYYENMIITPTKG